ncbi:MAG: PASTA domain-containing protein [Ignavibacteria bacterium]
MLKKLGILSLIVVAFVLLFNSILMPWYVKHSNLVKVPSVTGMNFLDAKKVLEQSGLDVKQGDIRYDESKPIGFVMDQAPAVDEMVKNGRRVYLTVCGGEQLMEVPRLIGKTERDAKFSLVQRNLLVGEVVRKFTTEQPEDFVISQVIQPGSKVKKGTKVDLIVSNGQLLGSIIIPDVIGKKLADAKKLIEDKKLRVGKITYQSSDLPVGQVIDQYPKKDKSAKDNTPVDLFIAKKKTENDKALEDVGDNDKEPKEKSNTDEKDKKEKTKPADEQPKDKTTDKTKEKVTDKPKEKTPDKPKEKAPDKPKEKQ